MDTDCKMDEDFQKKWGEGGRTAKMKAAQTCYDKGYSSAKINDCGGWKFKATCSELTPIDWSKPYSDESAKEEGFTDRNTAMIANCKLKGYSGINKDIWKPNDNIFPNAFFSTQCVGATNGITNNSNGINTSTTSGINTNASGCKMDEDFQKKWGEGGRTAKMKTSQACYDKGFYTAKIKDCGSGTWKFEAECSETTPIDWSKPYSDESAKEEGFTDRNKAMIANCKNKGYDGIIPSNYIDKGEGFFSTQCSKVNWGSPVSGCDGAGSTITIQKCENWVDNDPNSCNGGSKPKDIKKWIHCDIGSSPGGILPSDNVRLCSPITDNFDCRSAKNCFAITKFEPNTCEHNFFSDPSGAVKQAGDDVKKNTDDFFSKIKIILILIIIILIFCSSGVAVFQLID
jgi:hypothetical protein